MGATNWEQKWFQNLVLAINMAYCLLPCFFSPLNSLSWVVQFVAHLTTTSGKIPAILSAAFDLYPCGIFCFAGNGNLPFGHQHESHSTALGWCSAVKQQQPNHSVSTCPCFFIWETSSMVISGMNILYVCACVCVHVCVQLLSRPLWPLMRSTKQPSKTHTSWMCAYLRRESSAVPMRQVEKFRKDGKHFFLQYIWRGRSIQLALENCEGGSVIAHLKQFCNTYDERKIGSGATPTYLLSFFFSQL